jgi:uracil-DNA glycosylase
MLSVPWHDQVAPDWVEALSGMSGRLEAISASLRDEVRAGRSFLPDESAILRAFTLPLAHVRVVIVGQDPYPTPGHAMGLAFSVDPRVRPLPRSLRNIHAEWHADLGHPLPDHGDLSAWHRAGVLLLNRMLTVAEGRPGSHRGMGWEEVTAHALRAVAERGGPVVAILWGAQAQALRSLWGPLPVICSAHPSPLSAARGFLGSRPFSAANRALAQAGGDPVDWRL